MNIFGMKRKRSKNSIKETFLLAKQLHLGQRRLDGEPYFNHVYRVFTRVAACLENSENLHTAILHDTVEDCVGAREALRHDKYSGEVIDGVEVLTKPYSMTPPMLGESRLQPRKTLMEKITTHEGQLAALKQSYLDDYVIAQVIESENTDLMLIKLADLYDNVSSASAVPGSNDVLREITNGRRREKYEEAIQILEEELGSIGVTDLPLKGFMSCTCPSR